MKHEFCPNIPRHLNIWHCLLSKNSGALVQRVHSGSWSAPAICPLVSLYHIDVHLWFSNKIISDIFVYINLQNCIHLVCSYIIAVLYPILESFLTWRLWRIEASEEPSYQSWGKFGWLAFFIGMASLCFIWRISFLVSLAFGMKCLW